MPPPPQRSSSAAAFRAELPDGSRVERNFRVETEADGKARRVGYGSWFWLVYDPDRRPSRKRVNLRTKDKGAATGKALALAKRRSLGAFDPWMSADGAGGTPLTEAVMRYLVEKGRTASAATVESDKGHLERLGRLLPAGTDVRHIEASSVEAYVNSDKPRLKDGTPRGAASPQTKARRRASLAHFFSWAMAAGLCSTNPAEGVRLPKSTKARRDHVTDDEAAAVLRAVAAAEAASEARRPGEGKVTTFSGVDRGWLRDWVVFGLGTGLRPGEQQQLRWSAVRLAERAVEIGKDHAVKTAGSRRTVPVAGAALDVLRRLHEARVAAGVTADGPVFTGAGGERVAVDYLSDRLQHFAESAGVRKTVTAYVLRHAYGTRMAAAGVPLLDLARIMGTSVAMIERHYGHHSPDRAASHVERVFGAAATQ
ncbi:MAG TPA: tyrosine-type recombinase/integrase [Rubricoccaceae bacterium]|jgi:site-specific recombinase XerD